jgi:3'-5' exoribonuclease
MSATLSHETVAIESFKPGETFENRVFLVSQKDLRTTNNGSLYIHMGFVDRSGQVVGRIWQATQQMYDLIPEGGFIAMRGRVESYKGNLQVIGEAIRPVKRDDIDLAAFLPSTQHNVDEMWKRVLSILRTVESKHLLALIKAFVSDEFIVDRFKRAPAAITNHHAYVGGLLEHTCSLLGLATRVFGADGKAESHFPGVSRDLVIVGLFLHDIGKTTELTYDTSFSYSTTGQLVGHITQAAIWIDRKSRDAAEITGEPFPDDLKDVLTHIVLAHHGTYEFGSPRLPACPEALAVHYLDNLDAKINMAMSNIESSRNQESDWTQYIRPLETRVYQKDVMGIRGGDVATDQSAS